MALSALNCGMEGDPMKRKALLLASLFAFAGAVPATGAAEGPSGSANCTAQFVVYDVIQAGAPHGASQDLAIIAQPPKDFPPMSNVGFFSRTNCA
jgi:hypothetical protein